jgi:hypothetical protein
MNCSAGEAIDSFIVFMDGKGNEVQEKLTDHFVALRYMAGLYGK